MGIGIGNLLCIGLFGCFLFVSLYANEVYTWEQMNESVITPPKLISSAGQETSDYKDISQKETSIKWAYSSDGTCRGQTEIYEIQIVCVRGIVKERLTPNVIVEDEFGKKSISGGIVIKTDTILEHIQITENQPFNATYNVNFEFVNLNPTLRKTIQSLLGQGLELRSQNYEDLSMYDTIEFLRDKLVLTNSDISKLGLGQWTDFTITVYQNPTVPTTLFLYGHMDNSQCSILLASTNFVNLILDVVIKSFMSIFKWILLIMMIGGFVLSSTKKTQQ